MITNLILASSLLILFSSNSLALAFLKSAINCTNPRMFALFPDVPRLKKPAAAEVAMIGYWLSSSYANAVFSKSARGKIRSLPRASDSNDIADSTSLFSDEGSRSTSFRNGTWFTDALERGRSHRPRRISLVRGTPSDSMMAA